jgi:hypothetical protein
VVTAIRRMDDHFYPIVQLNCDEHDDDETIFNVNRRERQVRPVPHDGRMAATSSRSDDSVGLPVSRETWRRNRRETLTGDAESMLLRQLLVRLPDRPGSLGQVTTLLGRLGVDIRQVRVLDRDGESALDEFEVEVPGVVVERNLPALLEDIAGVQVEAMSDSFAIAGAVVEE